MLTLQATRYSDNAMLIVPATSKEHLEFDATNLAALLDSDADFILECINWAYQEGFTFCTFESDSDDESGDDREQTGEIQILIDGEVPSHEQVWQYLND